MIEELKQVRAALKEYRNIDANTRFWALNAQTDAALATLDKLIAVHWGDGQAVDQAESARSSKLASAHYAGDRLRKKLGKEAVQAIMEGKAGVFTTDSIWVTDVWGNNGFWKKNPVRLDRPEGEKP